MLILAGPNGAGKTTASRLVVPPGMVFVNADIIARELADEGHPIEGLQVAAGRLVLAEIRRLETARASFCVETNLAGRGLTRSIRTWQESGYTVRLAFVALVSPELALARVAHRVAEGGHDVPGDVVRRRWRQGLEALFSLYLDLADSWRLTDNSADHAVAVASGGKGGSPRILDRSLWVRYRSLARTNRL